MSGQENDSDVKALGSQRPNQGDGGTDSTAQLDSGLVEADSNDHDTDPADDNDTDHRIDDGTKRRPSRTLVAGTAAALVIAGGLAFVILTDSGADMDYDSNLAMIRTHSGRNMLLDESPFRDVPMDDLDISDSSPLLGPRTDYLDNTNGNPEQAFPIEAGGQFRTSCEFSHFAYDDPLVHPNEPGRAHLHMFFGNTDINAFSTYETMRDSGSSTCNGQELNRTGYWAPAMIDGDGNVRIPERVVVYYKGEGLSNASNYPEFDDVGAKVYEPRMANIASQPRSVPELATFDGGEDTEFNFGCTNNFSPAPFATGIGEIPNCSGDYWLETEGQQYPTTRTVLEMKIMFWNCYVPEGEDNDWTRWQPSGNTRGSWYYSNCDGQGGQAQGSPPLADKDHYPNLIYFVNYVVEPGEDTSRWFLSSDVDGSDPDNPRTTGSPGSTHHADWWGAWHPDINQEFIDNCVNFNNAPEPSGCGSGYLSDGGPDGSDPIPGRALRYRDQYDVPGVTESYRVPLATLFAELCEPLDPAHSYDPEVPMTGGYCRT